MSPFLAEAKEGVERTLDEILSRSRSSHPLLLESTRYAVLEGGKRLRPLLCVGVAEHFGVGLKESLHPACALEMIHAYSMVHDDLPCMDNDDFRRGKPTVHKKYGEWQALLAGDGLLTEAFGVLARAPHLSDEVRLRLVDGLVQAAGLSGMVGGQYLDLMHQGGSIEKDVLVAIHQKKTGALIEAALSFGGILGRASEEEIALLAGWGEWFGLAFQLMDDLLDVFSSREKHGKETPSDIVNGTCTSVSLLGVEATKAWAEALLTSCEEENRRLGEIDILAHFVEEIRTKHNTLEVTFS